VKTAGTCSFNGELALVRSLVEKVVLELITGVKSTAEVKRSLLAHAVRRVACVTCIGNAALHVTQRLLMILLCSG
jgi:hypothetical protein